MNFTLNDLKTKPVIGNAYNDFDLIKGSYRLTQRFLEQNQVDLAYETMDIMGVRVMGLPPQTWEEFVEGLTWTENNSLWEDL